MAIRTTCPGCDAAFKIHEDMNGQQVRCKACQTVFVVHGDGWRPIPPRAPLAPPPPTNPPPTQLPEVEPVAEGPPVVQPIPTVTAASAAYSRAPLPPRRQPQRPPQPATSSALSALLAVIVIGGTLLVLGGLAAGIAFLVYEVQRDERAKRTPQITTQAPGFGRFFRPEGRLDLPLWQWDASDVTDAQATTEGPDRPELLSYTVKDLAHQEAGPRSFRLENPVPLLTPEQLKAAAGITDGSLPGDVLRRVEQATVRLRVTQTEGQGRPSGEGSGFFCFDPGIIVTNAHVVFMKEPGAAKPALVEVFVNSGEADEARLTAQVLVADGHTDLAILKVREKDAKLPEPLKLVSAKTLRRTQPLVAFGFPFGENLNKRLSTSKVSMASTVDDNGELHRVQMNGELNPGNSGGPVVDGNGRVAGVAVAIFQIFRGTNTGISYAVPADQAQHLYQGRLEELAIGQPAREQEEAAALPVTVRFKDPLERIKRVGVEWWIGTAGESHTASFDPPTADARQSVMLDVQKGQAKGQLLLPPLPPGKVYVLQPFCQSKKEGSARWANTAAFELPPPVERRPVAVADAAVPEQLNMFRFASRSRSAEKGIPNGHASPLTIDLSGRVKVAGSPDQEDEYTDFKLGVRVGDKTLARTTLLNLLNRKHAGQASRGERRMFAGAGEHRQELAAMGDAVHDLWRALPFQLPVASELKAGHSWSESRKFVVNVVDGTTATLNINCTYLGARANEGRQEAVVSLEGVLGDGQQGPGARSTARLTGTAWIDVAANRAVLVTASLDATLDVTDSEGEPTQLASQVEYRLERVK